MIERAHIPFLVAAARGPARRSTRRFTAVVLATAAAIAAIVGLTAGFVAGSVVATREFRKDAGAGYYVPASTTCPGTVQKDEE